MSIFAKDHGNILACQIIGKKFMYSFGLVPVNTSSFVRFKKFLVSYYNFSQSYQFFIWISQILLAYLDFDIVKISSKPNSLWNLATLSVSCKEHVHAGLHR
jgi:hypothetical protein